MESGLISTGFQLGLVQIEIPNYEPQVRLNPPDSPWLWVTEYEDDIFFIGDEFRLTFDKCTGEISEWRCQGTKMLTEALAPNFWRVITDNDFGNRMDARCKVSKEASNNRELKEITLLAIDSNLVTLGVAYYFPDVYARYKMLYHINAFSEIMVDNSMELLEIPRPDIDVLTD